MTCPNCRGVGRLRGDGYDMACHVCGETGLCSRERWADVKAHRLNVTIKTTGDVVYTLLEKQPR